MVTESAALSGGGAAITDLWSAVVGQDAAVAVLRQAAREPVHAYLFVGRVGSGTRAAARAFAAELLSHGSEAAEAERHRQLALAEHHPALTVVERSGASIGVEQADDIVRRASRSPAEGERQVLMLTDFHLVSDAAPKLLKSIEEPPASTYFVILADDVSPELVTIASRCVRVEFPPLPLHVVSGELERSGVERDRAAAVAGAAGGDLERARALLDDDSLMERREFWFGTPDRLDGSGARAAQLTKEVKTHIEAALEAVVSAQELEMAKAVEDAERLGLRAGAVKQLEARHKREQRRIRVDELRSGVAQIADRYRAAMGTGTPPSAYSEAGELLGAFTDALVFNPNEDLQLQALFVSLPRLD